MLGIGRISATINRYGDISAKINGYTQTSARVAANRVINLRGSTHLGEKASMSSRASVDRSTKAHSSMCVVDPFYLSFKRSECLPRDEREMRRGDGYRETWKRASL